MVRNLARLWHAKTIITAVVVIATGPGVASATVVNGLSTVPTGVSQNVVSGEVSYHDASFHDDDDLAVDAPTIVAEKPLTGTETSANRSLLTKKILTASSTLALFLVGLAGIIYLVRRHRRTIEYLCPVWRPKKDNQRQSIRRP